MAPLADVATPLCTGSQSSKHCFGRSLLSLATIERLCAAPLKRATAAGTVEVRFVAKQLQCFRQCSAQLGPNEGCSPMKNGVFQCRAYWANTERLWQSHCGLSLVTGKSASSSVHAWDAPSQIEFFQNCSLSLGHQAVFQKTHKFISFFFACTVAHPCSDCFN